MPVVYTKSGGQGHEYQVPDYPEASDGPKAFKDFADYLDLILPPVGTIMPYVGNTAPTGWLLCDGASYSSTSYPKLSVLCGTKFGTASAGLFKVPDLKGRSIAGLDSGQSEFDTIGKAGGAKSVTLTVSNMPAHDHTIPAHTHTASTSSLSASSAGDHQHTVSGSTATDGQHQHQYYDSSFTSAAVASGTGANRLWQETVSATNTFNTLPNTILHSHSINLTSTSQGDHTHSITGNITINQSTEGTSGSKGSGTAVNTLNPYLTLNHIIRAA